MGAKLARATPRSLPRPRPAREEPEALSPGRAVDRPLRLPVPLRPEPRGARAV